MALDAGSADASEVHPDIKAFWSDLCPQHPKRKVRHPDQVEGAIGGQRVQGFDVRIGRDHEMTTVVRKEVHHDESVLPSVEQQVVRVSLFPHLQAEDTSSRLSGVLDVSHAPGRPYDLHRIGRAS